MSKLYSHKVVMTVKSTSQNWLDVKRDVNTAMNCGIVYENEPLITQTQAPEVVSLPINHPHLQNCIDFADEYEQLYFDLMCKNMEEFKMVSGGMFGKPDFKKYLEDKFNIKL